MWQVRGCQTDLQGDRIGYAHRASSFLGCHGAVLRADFVGGDQHKARHGVTAFEDADCGPVPAAFVAETLKVYVVPAWRPVTVVDVAGGEPVTAVAGWAVVPMKGVTV